jgi:hypothetical protein
MAFTGRPRGPQPNGPQRTYLRPPQMGNAFGFGSFQTRNEPNPRFPRPDSEATTPNERVVSPDPYARGGKFYRPSSTTISDTDSERTREMDNLRIEIASLQNELLKDREARKKMEEDLARIASQPPQPSQQPPPTNNRTAEQQAAREYVHQWARSGPSQPPQTGGPPPQLDNTQSTMTGLANQFQKITLDSVNNVLSQIGASARRANENKPTTRLHLAPAEEQHIKMIEEQSNTDAQIIEQQAVSLIMAKAMQQLLPVDMEPIIAQIQNSATQATQKLLNKKKQISNVTQLADRFTVTVPMPIIETPPYGFVRDRDTLDLRNIDKRVAHFNPDADPDRCFATFMSELNTLARNQYLQEHNWFAMLDTLLRGEAKTEYQECRRNDNTLEETIQHLGLLYTRSNTIDDDKRDLESFARKPKEDLSRAMARYTGKIKKLQPLYDAAAFPAIMDSQRQTGLFSIVTPKTRSYLEIENAKATMAGAPMKVDSLIRLASTFEKTYNEVPTMTITSGTNSVELQRKVAQQSSALKSIEKANTQSAEVTKKLEELIQVAAASFKRDRSADKNKHKSTSSKPAYRSSSRDGSSRNNDVIMTDVSQNPATTYPDNKSRADKTSAERFAHEKKKLYEEYLKKRNGQTTTQTGTTSGSSNYNRGRSSTPGRSNQARSGSSSSQRSGGGQSRSHSASSDKEAGSTSVSVDIWHKSNFLTCMVCELEHPPFIEICPAAGNQLVQNP